MAKVITVIFFLIGEMSRPADHAIMIHRSLQLAKKGKKTFFITEFMTVNDHLIKDSCL